MTEDTGHGDRVRRITEEQRTPEFRRLRSDIITRIKDIATAAENSELTIDEEVVVNSNVRGGGVRVSIPTKTDQGYGARTILFRPDQYTIFEEGSAYTPEGHEDIFAVFDEEVFDDATHSFHRIGWQVRGDGNVERLFYEFDGDGVKHNAERLTNDVEDLEMATNYLMQVATDIIKPAEA